MKKLKCHPTADEVYAQVSAEHPTISRGTVYRNLNQLMADGEIIGVALPGSANHFDDRRDRHFHAQCLKCGSVFDMDLESIPDLSQQIKETHGFAFSGYDIIFKGLCTACQTTEHPSEF